MEEDDKGCPIIRMGVSGWVFLLVPAYPGSPGQKAVKRLCVCVCVCVCVAPRSHAASCIHCYRSSYCAISLSRWIKLVTNRGSGEGIAIGRVRPSVRLFRFNLWTDWPLTLIPARVKGHDHSSQGIESQGHRSRTRSPWSRLGLGLTTTEGSFSIVFFTCATLGQREY